MKFFIDYTKVLCYTSCGDNMDIIYEIETKKYVDKIIQNCVDPMQYLELARIPNIPRSCINRLQQLVAKSQNDELIYNFAQQIKGSNKEFLYNSISIQNKELKIIFIINFLKNKINDFYYFTGLDIELCENILSKKDISIRELTNIAIENNSTPLLSALIKYKNLCS